MPYLFAALIAPVALLGVTATPVAASAPAAVAKKHHKKRHHKKHHKATHHTATPPKSTKPKLGDCATTVSGTGPVAETGTYAYQLIIACSEGEFGSFTAYTNRAIVAGSITAKIGERYTYTCQQTASTSFSCSGVNAAIPSDEAAAIRAFFKSAQPPCIGSAPETASVSTQGETFTAQLGEVQGSC